MNVVEEVKKLISIPSVTGNEKEIGTYIAEKFRSLGCRTEIFQVDKDRFNILAVLGPEKNDPMGVLFHGHMDTAAPFGMVFPFTPSIRENHIWGRGSVDQKGGIAAVISCFEQVISSGMNLHRKVGFVCVVDEEEEHRGSMHLADMGIQAECAIITEPSALKLGIGCKGTVPIKMSVKGKASHGCRPWLGESAVIHGMNITRELLNSTLPVYHVEGIGDTKATLNLGIVNGGTAYNMVPGECVFWFDRRLVPGENPKEVLDDFESLITGYESPGGVSFKVEVDRPDWHWEPIKQRGLLPALTDINSGLVQTVKTAHNTILGTGPELYFTDGYQEMDFLVNDLGIPAVQYGPGDGGLCHTDRESLDIEQLKTAVSVYSEIVRMLCGGTDED